MSMAAQNHQLRSGFMTAVLAGVGRHRMESKKPGAYQFGGTLWTAFQLAVLDFGRP